MQVAEGTRAQAGAGTPVGMHRELAEGTDSAHAPVDTAAEEGTAAAEDTLVAVEEGTLAAEDTLAAEEGTQDVAEEDRHPVAGAAAAGTLAAEEEDTPEVVAEEGSHQAAAGRRHPAAAEDTRLGLASPVDIGGGSASLRVQGQRKSDDRERGGKNEEEEGRLYRACVIRRSYG
jgi:hypothetical protein